MAGVTWQLASASFVDLPTLAIGVVAAILLFRYKVNPAWLVLGGAVAGLLVWLFSG
jgi:chromate transporter